MSHLLPMQLLPYQASKLPRAKFHEPSSGSSGRKASDSAAGRIQEFKTENLLLGRLLSDTQARCQQLESQDKKRVSEAHAARARAQEQTSKCHEAERQAAEMAAERDRIQATLTSQTAAMRRLKKRERQLEDLVLELRDADEATEASIAALHQEAATLREERSEALKRAKLADAQARALRDQLTSAQAACEQNVTTAQYEAHCLAERLQSHATEAVHSAEASAREAAQRAQLRVAALEGESSLLVQQNQQLHESLQAATSKLAAAAHASSDLLRGSQDAAAAVHELTALRKRNHELQQALAHQHLPRQEPQLADSASACEVERLAAACAELARERDEARSQVTQASATSSYSQHLAASGSAAVEALRADVVRLTQRLGAVVGTNAELLHENSLLLDQVQAAEGALAQTRSQVIIARRSVVSLEASNIDELFRRAAAAAGSRAESPLDHDSHSLLAGAHHSAPDSMSPPSDAEHSGDRFDGLAVYCRVLEHANQEHKRMLEKVGNQLHESCELEGKARELLSDARAHERLAYKRIVSEAERVRTLESMRLTDLQQLHQLQRDLLQAPEQCPHCHRNGTQNGGRSPAPPRSRNQSPNFSEHPALQPIDNRSHAWSLRTPSPARHAGHSSGAQEDAYLTPSKHMHDTRGLDGFRIPQQRATLRVTSALEAWHTATAVESSWEA